MPCAPIPASGIVNDANRYAVETAGDPAYPFKLFCRMFTVSLKTQRRISSPEVPKYTGTKRR